MRAILRNSKSAAQRANKVKGVILNIAELLSPPPVGEIWERNDPGITLAAVTNISDPDNLGRVKCKPITDDPDVAETDWCFCMTQWGGKAYGSFFFPNVNDLVLLAYIEGQIHRPIVIGNIWQGDIEAPYKIESGKNEVVSIKSQKGCELKFELTEGKEKITITTPSGALIKIDDEAASLSVSDKEGENALLIDAKGGKINLKAKTEINIAAGDTTLKLTSDGAIAGKSSQSFKAEAAQIELKAQSAFKAEGAQIEVKAQAQMSLQSSGNAVLKGAIVQIN